MAKKSKRRASSRKRSESVKRASLPADPKPSWLAEIGAVVCGGGALFLILSISSDLLLQPASLTTEVVPVPNVMGPVGHAVATVLIGFLGLCAVVPALWLLYWAYNLCRPRNDAEQKKKFKLSMVLVGLLCAHLAVASLAGIFWGKTGGGSIGLLLAEPLARLFNRFGAAFLSAVLLFLSCAFLTRRSLWGMSKGVVEASARGSMTSLAQLPRLVWEALKGALRLAVFLVEVPAAAAWSYLASMIQGRPEIEEPVLPAPRRRKNEIEIEDEDDELLEGEGEGDDEEEYSEIVVKRRTAEHKLSAALERRLARKKPGQVEEGDEYKDYQPPALALLQRSEPVAAASEDDAELRQKSRLIESKLKDFSISGRITEVHPGPVITLFEFEPAAGVKVGRIAALQDDLAMALRASSIRIVAPIPKKGTVGIEVPNRHRDVVRLRDVLESEAFVNSSSILNIPIGKDTYGEPLVADVGTMPHLLIAGATGTGKSVFLNALLLSLLYRARPEELGLILIDPKILELSVYEGIPHLRVPVVTSPKQAKAVFEWAIHEMNRRYRLMQRFGVRGVDGYNQMVAGEGEERPAGKARPGLDQQVVMLREDDVLQAGTIEKADLGRAVPPFSEVLKPLPKIMIVVDELADLMLSVGREIEELITRLAQKARAAGIHLIVATQRPSVDVVTGLIKANFPARISFRVSSRVDSRTILDSMGAEKLLGRGDLLFMLPGAEAVKRVHGAYVSDSEVRNVVAVLKEKCTPRYDQRIMDVCEKALQEESSEGNAQSNGTAAAGGDEYDEFYDKAVELVLEKGQASTSMIQRAFRIGYNRAARIIDIMERDGVVGPMDGVKPRQVLVPQRAESGDEIG